MGEPGQVERRLGAQGRRLDRAAPGRQVEAADAHLRQPQPAGDRRLLRAVHLRLRPSAERARDEGEPDGAPAQPHHRHADGQDRLGPELGGDPRRRVQQAQRRPEFRRLRGRAEGDGRRVREHLHDVPAPAVRALPQPVLRGELPLRLDLQARGRRHRADRPGQVPRLAHVRLRLPVQEDLLQLEERQGREVHLLLPAHRGGSAHRVLRDLRRPHPLPRRDALRRRPHPGSGERRARPRPLPGAAATSSSTRTTRR